MRRFRKAGLLVAALSLVVGGCGGEPREAAEAPVAAEEDENEIARRLAFMAGHVEAGIALYRAGEGAAGGPHLLHPVSEAYAEEREGLDRIGFDPEPFRQVSEALEEGRSAAEIEPQLQAVEANLASMRERAGGDPADLIVYLMQLVGEEYAIAVTDGAVSDPGEYQDAWGFAQVARKLADDPALANGEGVRAALDDVIALWPYDAPVPPTDPTPPAEVRSRTEAVIEALEADA